MSIQFGSDNMGEIRYGKERITKVYFGNTLVYDKPYIKIKFHFDRTNINPRGKLGTRAKACGAEWISTDDPQIWYVITPLYDKGTAPHDTLTGIGKLFCSENDENGTLLQSSVGTCQVLEITGDVDRIETLDRLFNKCSAITSVNVTGFYNKFANSTTLVNVNSLVNGDSNITDGTSLSGYNILNTILSINTHAATFANADSAANLAQIPVGWGGTQVPPSTLMVSNRGRWWNNYDVWTITADGPDWTNMIGVYILTESKISQFTGVSMNRSRIKDINGFAHNSGHPLYFYPCFMQHNANYVTWAVMTERPNGHLEATQGNTDMAGILDYTTYGVFAYEYGTYDSSQDVYFTFFVTDVPIEQWGGLNTAYGILFNSYFNTDAGLRWFTM
jgi:hypothetical protein